MNFITPSIEEVLFWLILGLFILFKTVKGLGHSEDYLIVDIGKKIQYPFLMKFESLGKRFIILNPFGNIFYIKSNLLCGKITLNEIRKLIHIYSSRARVNMILGLNAILYAAVIAISILVNVFYSFDMALGLIAVYHIASIFILLYCLTSLPRSDYSLSYKMTFILNAALVPAHALTAKLGLFEGLTCSLPSLNIALSQVIKPPIDEHLLYKLEVEIAEVLDIHAESSETFRCLENLKGQLSHYHG